MLGLFKKKEQSTLSESLKQLDSLKKKKNMDEIWNITDKMEFVMVMYSRISKKCKDGEKIESLTMEEKIFYVCKSFEKAINNGSFIDYLRSEKGTYANDLEKYFKAIGAYRTADICKKATEAFGREIPRDDLERDDFLDDITWEMEVTLKECEENFFDYKDDLEKLYQNYALAHRGSFI